MALKDIWEDIVEGDFIDPKQINDVAHGVIDNENRTDKLENEIYGENGWNEQAKAAAIIAENAAKEAVRAKNEAVENASIATDKARLATDKASEAAVSADNASASEETATDKAEEAGKSANAATEAKEAAEKARDDAETAKGFAEDAATKAENATEFLKNGALFANAIRGKVIGAVISADDVSPIEHELDIKVSSKNLFKMPDKITSDSNKAEIIDNSIVITNTANSSWTGLNKKLKELCPSLKVGDAAVLTYTSTNTSNTGKYIYLSGENKTWNNGASKTITEASLNSNVILYCSITELNEITTVSNIQIEKGTVATAYTPYVDVEGVNVTVTDGENTQTATADAGGNVEGLVSMSPSMTLATDNADAVIECEYNRDANKVITDLETKLNTLIATIGG